MHIATIGFVSQKRSGLVLSISGVKTPAPAFGFVSQNPLASAFPQVGSFCKNQSKSSKRAKNKSNRMIQNDFHKNGFVLSREKARARRASTGIRAGRRFFGFVCARHPRDSRAQSPKTAKL